MSCSHCEGRQWLARLSTMDIFFIFWPLFFSGSLLASEPIHSTVFQPKPAIALIIDDLGNDLQRGEQVVNLPGPIACAFLPHGVYTQRLARFAHSNNKEVMLHLPMQSMDHHALDPGALTLDMTESVFTKTLLQDLAAVPHVSGINNHMGSLLTRHPGHMYWLMTVMHRQASLFFVDSRTTDRSVARQIAIENGVPNLKRDVFLDVERDRAAILQQFVKLVEKAYQNGTALGIAHPYPETLDVLESELGNLQAYGLQLVTVQQLIELKQERRNKWHASLFH